MRFRRTLTRFALTVLVPWCLLRSEPAQAALLDLSDLPLFLSSNNASPNVLFVVDDSGSMDWEVMTQDVEQDGRFASSQPDGTNPPESGPIKHRDDNDDGVPDCSFAKNGQTFNGYIYTTKFPNNTYGGGGGQNCNIVDDQSWRFRSGAFNPLYFDPTRTYKPWTGLDEAGNPFKDMPITAAKNNPYLTNSPTIDLTRQNSKLLTSDRNGDGKPDGFRYYTWTDRNGDGKFDNGEEDEYLIQEADAKTQQNFANWFSYHRRREYVTKAAYGEVLSGLSAKFRVGLVTLHNNAGSNLAIDYLNEDATTGHKRKLLDSLYQIRSSGSTPLLNSLHNVGTYLECQTGHGLGFTDCPALTAAEGGSCQQNFALLMTDGFYEDGSTFKKVGNTDGPDAGNTDWDGGAYADNHSDTLADVAMHYYERDLHPHLDNNVPILPGIDEARHQHLVTYTIAFGVDGSLKANPLNKNEPFPWPNPDHSQAAKIDDLRHAAFNGRGEFYSAKKPEELVETLRSALNSVQERISSAASVALNSGAHNTDSHVYQARFNTASWTGELWAYPIDENGNVKSAVWDAGEVLETQLKTQDWSSGRNILTYHRATKTGIPFQWNALNTAMQDLLHHDAMGVKDNRGVDRLQFLRGRRDQEGDGGLRVRQRVLGDLINSDPVFVGPPLFPDEIGDEYAPPYRDFRNANAQREPMIYVGGNDGMLHAFAAKTGGEKLAYVPGVLFDKLSQLTNPQYKHHSYVDGSPTVADAYGTFGSHCSTGSACWRSILVSGLRRGGQAVFALDVTDPSTFAEGNAAKVALWEFTDADDADLGYIYSVPSIVKMSGGRWAVLFGNGYNNTEADGHPSAEAEGRGFLYILFLDKGLDGTWELGTDYIKLPTGVGDPSSPNGLAGPSAVDINGDFTADYIYAGDLQGNLWRFDVRGDNPSQWGTPEKLFIAQKDGIRQPITTQPEIGKHPGGGFIVYFGTGKYLENDDHSTTGVPTQSFYGIWDKPESTTPVPRSDLLPQTVKEIGGTRVTSLASIEDCQTYRGWYLDLPTAGERQVTNSILRNGRIIFTTMIPNTVVCSFGGSSWLMEVDAICGNRLDESPFDLNGDHKFDDADKITVSGESKPVVVSGILSTEGIASTPAVLFAKDKEFKYSSGSSGGIFKAVENPGPNVRGRIAWYQYK